MLFWNKTDAFAIVEEAHASESTLPVGMRGFSDIFFLARPNNESDVVFEPCSKNKQGTMHICFAAHDRVYMMQRVDRYHY